MSVGGSMLAWSSSKESPEDAAMTSILFATKFSLA